MNEKNKSIFSVDASGDIVVLKINGRASYLTSAPVNNLFSHLLDRGKNQFLVDFKNCLGMDSTFLGILAGAAMRIRREFPDGGLELCRLNNRNLELVRNLGLHRILTIRGVDAPEDAGDENAKFETLLSGSVESNSMLEAHRNLVDADESNQQKFEDVIKFLEKETN